MRKLLCLILCLIHLQGCTTLGNLALQDSRSAYNEAIARTSTEQLLLNLVRMKFRDTPLFLQVGSVASQYTFSKTLGLNPTFNDGDRTLLGTMQLGHIEQPTITLTPLQGEQFSRQLMRPIEFDTLLLLSSSGWSIERILRCCVQHMNGIPNAPTAAGPTPEKAPEYQDFYRLSEHIRTLQDTNAIIFERAQNGYAISFILGENPSAVTLDAIAEIEKLLGRGKLGISGEYKIPIKISTRSLYATLFFLSQGVQVPDSAVESGLVTKTFTENGELFDWNGVTKNIIKVKSSQDAPLKSYVSIFYRGYYYYVEDNDLTSKATMMLIDQLFSLQSGTPSNANSPALTLNVGR